MVCASVLERVLNVCLPFGVDQTCMLIIMAVNAQIFPIAAMGWIVVVIMILVMYGQFMKVLLIEPRPQRPQTHGWILRDWAR
ncbi:MAG: hypothetical protein CM1200mP18_06970 [Gammaproteobacteria bacterium]|nr:MAG: hypothetical protein CM1200mP18_06970 [Gammaproteobacteria bacterium]